MQWKWSSKVRLPGKKRRFVKLRRTGSDRSVFKQIFINEEYGFVMPYIPDVIVDAGANIGLSAIYFHQKFPSAFILAVEPDRENFEFLEKNTQGIAQIKCLRGAVWSESKIVNFDSHGDDQSGYMVIDDSPGADGVQGYTVSELMSRFHIDGIDLLKLDIEGGEFPVFMAGNQKEWSRKTGVIAIEIHEKEKKGESERLIFRSIDHLNTVISESGENKIIVNQGYERVSYPIINDEKDILNKYSGINSVLHIGGCHCQEFETYEEFSVRSVFVEPLPEMVAYAKRRYPRISVLQYVASNVDRGIAEFHVTSDNNLGASSLFHLKESLSENPDIRFSKTIKVETRTLDSIVAELDFVPSLLVLDVQCAEGLVLSGATDTLLDSRLRYIFTEVNFSEMYEGCILWDDLKRRLTDFGFVVAAVDKWFNSGIHTKSNAANVLFTRESSV